MSNEIALVNASEISQVENNFLNPNQLGRLLKKTPAKYLKTRPAKGGGTWQYVSGGYVKKCLNIMFGWDWDFEIVEQLIMHKEAIVKGKLTVRSGGRQIVKTQFGNKDIIYRKGTDEPLSIGNDLKAAATDALKKCASELGIAADVYNAQEFNEVIIQDDTIDVTTLSQLYDLKKDLCNDSERINFERIINNGEADKFQAVYKIIQAK